MILKLLLIKYPEHKELLTKFNIKLYCVLIHLLQSNIILVQLIM